MSAPEHAKRILNALSPCTGNWARSIFAEAILNRLGLGRFAGHSAGSRPKEQIHPRAPDLLGNLNHPAVGLRSKSRDVVTGPDVPQMDFVFTVRGTAATEVCPAWPGQPMSAHRGVPDPGGRDRQRGGASPRLLRKLPDAEPTDVDRNLGFDIATVNEPKGGAEARAILGLTPAAAADRAAATIG